MRRQWLHNVHRHRSGRSERHRFQQHRPLRWNDVCVSGPCIQYTAGPSGYSNTGEATTPAAPVPPAAPGSLTATATSISQIDLIWGDNSSNEDGFEIERCQGAGCSNFISITQKPAGTTSYSDTGRSAGTTYQYRVRAFNAGGSSGILNTATATTPVPPQSHVGDLDGSATNTKNSWQAAVTVTVIRRPIKD